MNKATALIKNSYCSNYPSNLCDQTSEFMNDADSGIGDLTPIKIFLKNHSLFTFAAFSSFHRFQTCN